MANNYRNEIIACQEEIYTLHRQLRNKTDNFKDALDEGFAEEDMLYLNLVRLISQAKEEELEANEAEELKTILAEVDKSRETIRQDIMSIFANS